MTTIKGNGYTLTVDGMERICDRKGRLLPIGDIFTPNIREIEIVEEANMPVPYVRPGIFKCLIMASDLQYSDKTGKRYRHIREDWQHYELYRIPQTGKLRVYHCYWDTYHKAPKCQRKVAI